MTRLWLRFLLWLDNVCPEHGAMREKSDGEHYCYPCYVIEEQRDITREQKRADRLKRIQEEYNDLIP